MLPLVVVLALSIHHAAGQSSPDSRLSRDRLRSGAETLHAFAPIAEATRHSVVKVDLDGTTVALAAVIDASGLAITKSSEIKTGKLTCWLSTGKEVDAELIARDDENDVALIRVRARGLKPIRWSFETVAVGQWAVTPGTGETPQAVGIVSVPARTILPKRAFIGVQLEPRASDAKIAQVMAGLGAERAGLRKGDLILAVNDAAVRGREELIDTLRTFREGEIVRLRVRRDDREFEAIVEMMVPEAESPDNAFDRRERGDRMAGEVSQRAEGFSRAIQHDAVLQPWQCGGPVVNLQGKAFGLNIARAGRVASYALPAELVRKIIERLKTIKESRSQGIRESGNWGLRDNE